MFKAAARGPSFGMETCSIHLQKQCAHPEGRLAADVSEAEVAARQADNCPVQLHAVHRQAQAAVQVDGQRPPSQAHHHHPPWVPPPSLPPLQPSPGCRQVTLSQVPVFTRVHSFDMIDTDISSKLLLARPLFVVLDSDATWQIPRL